MFKSYTSNDNLLLPPCLGDFIPQNDPVRVVHRIIEQINLEKLYRRYSPARNFSVATKMALIMLKNEKTTKGSMNLKRLKAGWDENYLSQLLRDNNF
ncbi:hypothetical protein GAZ81_22820 [Phocaeicola vulgatus]|nr:hypothetical protein GAZ81_22820 [Phocaeicola vulgatus]